MKAKFGTICMIFGAALLLGALSLFVYNSHEDSMAGESVDVLLPQLIEEIETRAETSPRPLSAAEEIPEALLTAEDVAMTEVEIDGYGYIGYLSVPEFSLELPVMGDWDYDRLKIAPCRYSGSTKSDDLVIMAHNYRSHFGRLRSVGLGEIVTFTDLSGNVFNYEAVDIETLQATQIEEMTSGDWDLTLFTCTTSGQARVAVRFELIG